MQAFKKIKGLILSATNEPRWTIACCTGPDGVYRVRADSQGPYKLTLSLSKVPTDGTTPYHGSDKSFYTNNGFHSSTFAIARVRPSLLSSFLSVTKCSLILQRDFSVQSCQTSLFYQSLDGDIYECRIDFKGNCKFVKVDSLPKKGAGIPIKNTALAASVVGNLTVVFYLAQDKVWLYSPDSEATHADLWFL
jgi:hypothetical protein